MNRILLILMIVLSLGVSAQTSEKYNSDYENFYRAEELFEKEQYAAARREFRTFLNSFDHVNDPMYIKASYYEAVSALELYNNDAVTLLLTFNQNYPESVYRKDIYFRLGKHFYRKKKYKDALAWFNKLSVQEVEKDDRDEFYFKIGYANFKEEQFEAARNAFVEIKDGDSQYAAPALYYYSHIAYRNEKYQIALEGFLKLESHEKFGVLVPYYIAQIYYLQGNFDEVTKYASKALNDKTGKKEKEINLLIGDAFYRIGKYDEAVPYLKKYNSASKTTRDEDYRLGYAYYKSGSYENAVRLFDRVNKKEDSLGQVAYYHIGECMLKLEDKVSARSAFEGAAFIDADPVIQEDALFNYAILSYKLDINPYDEAVEAFELYLNRYPESERKEDIYQYLVNVYMSTNNYGKALVSLDKLANKDIRLKQAYQTVAYNQGVSRYQKNDFSGAISSFKLVSKYPVDQSVSGMAVYWTADAYYRSNNYDQAIDHYKKFGLLPSTMLPDLKPEAYYNIGYSYLKKADVAHAQKNTEKRAQMLVKSREAFDLFIKSNPPGKQKIADAYMRIADSYYVTKDNAEAIQFYKKALQQKSGYEDQALFYMAKTYGYIRNKSSDKISKLLDIINNYPKSKYLLEAINEVAKTYMSTNQIDKALIYYNKIIFDYPKSVLYLDAKINAADIHYKQGKHKQAEEEYLAILQENQSDQKVCERAANGLKDIYTMLDQIDKIDQLASQYSCIQFDANERENLYYHPAIEVYFDSTVSDKKRFESSIPKLLKYLEKFPNGLYKIEMQSYLGNCYYQLEDHEKAVEVYKSLLEASNTSFTQEAAARTARYYFNGGHYEEAIPFYQRLEELASDPVVIFSSKKGLMRSHFHLENWQNSALYADMVLKDSKLSSELELEANYVKGLSNYHLSLYNDAKESLEWLVDNTTTIVGAEARYCLADIDFDELDYTSSHDRIDELMKMKPRHNYWIGRGLILGAKVYIAEDNLFQAERDLKSVIDHYKVSDDGVLDEANELWNELMQLKDTPKDIEEEGERIIEIDEQNEN